MGSGFVLSIRFCHTFKDRTANGKKYSDVSLDQLIVRFKKGLAFIDIVLIMKLLFVYLIFAFVVDDNKKLTIAAVIVSTTF